MNTIFDEIVDNKLRMYELELKTLERLDSKLKDFLDITERTLAFNSGLSFDKLFKLPLYEARLVAIRDPKYLLEYMLKSIENYMTENKIDYLNNVDVDGYRGIIFDENYRIRKAHTIMDVVKMLHFEYSALPNQHAGRPDEI